MWADMTLSKWFHDQLQSTADGFVWAVQQVAENRLYLQPETPVLGEWSAARHAYHMLHYEQTYAIPSMRQWLGGPVPDAAGVNEDAAWQEEHKLAEVLRKFRVIRAQQIAMLTQFEDTTWEELHETFWQQQSLRWVLSKTIQHTAEHTHDVLSIALFWDHLQGR
jgi:hypothetical protein